MLIININLNSNYYIIKEILPNMIKNRQGCIIGITSIVAFTGNPGQSNYTASKSGIISMYKSIALEVAQRNIRVNTIAPGLTNTDMMKKNTSQDAIKDVLSRVSLKRIADPIEIANVALMLSSDLSSYITGQVIRADGGM